ncbi:MBL fold metallo-hydrolase [Mycolicibacterium mucogenicum]|uniref:MBL fold metallo-hydrolase n=1 Tax=Mycolicibacterium mucogenicum TaxID=56689 RepID=UPI00226AF60E|nr:MBL fold metallo-hydrolase [Mycolicibacterium mucogenicum]MCX8558919.1 MBL fold metallo-hydrolase [Mycolicibacterium mucogenicum]
MHGCGPDCADGVDAISRRAAIAASVSALLGGAALATSAGSSAAPGSAELPQNALITLGVQAGPPPVANRTGISSALKIGDDVYQIDCGLGSLNAFTNAGLRFDQLRSLFITHLHTDHIVDYYSFFLSGGYTASPGKGAVSVYGPGPAGGLPPSEVGNPNPPTVEPANPTPGIAAMTQALHRAFAYTSNIFIRDMGTDDIQSLVNVNEVVVPPGSDYLNRAPRTEPFPVMTDDNVRVTATLVSHYDVYPAFAFRFDLVKSGVSVTFSGDTTKSDNLIALAQGTDILVHEAQFSLADGGNNSRFPPGYLVRSHTSAEQVGEVAAAAGAKHVVLSHYSPTDLPDSKWRDAIGRHYRGKITVARDGQVFAL